MRIELLGVQREIPIRFLAGRLNRRGTTEAQFRFPRAWWAIINLRYRCRHHHRLDQNSLQSVRLEDKVSILLTTEKPIYQPGQTIHVRALALDRSNHEAPPTAS